MGFSPEEAMAVYNIDQVSDYLSHFGAYLNKFGNSTLKAKYLSVELGSGIAYLE